MHMYIRTWIRVAWKDISDIRLNWNCQILQKTLYIVTFNNLAINQCCVRSITVTVKFLRVRAYIWGSVSLCGINMKLSIICLIFTGWDLGRWFRPYYVLACNINA